MKSKEEINHTDQYKYKGMRKRLVQLLAAKGNFDHKVLNAIEGVPRHYFLESAFAEQSYEDKAFPIGEGQTISQPYTVAYQTQLMDVKEGDKILEIGTGSGYQASILSTLGAKVYTIERVAKLSEKAHQMMKFLGYKAKFFIGDGTLGVPKFAPYDKILVTAAAPDVPEALLLQLKIGGFLIIPVGGMDTQQMYRVTRVADEKFTREVFENFRFVPLIGKEGW